MTATLSNGGSCVSIEDSSMKTKYEEVVRESEIRTKLWREFVSNYQRVLESEPEKLSKSSEKFRDKYLHAR